MTRRRDTAAQTELAAHAALLRLVAVAEDYAVASLVETTERLLPSTPPFIELMWERELAAARDWQSRRAAWRKLHGIDIQGRFSAFKSLDGFILARNIVAHGLGQLSAKQLVDATVSTRLAQCDLSILGGGIQLQKTHIEDCAFVCSLFVAWVDRDSRNV